MAPMQSLQTTYPPSTSHKGHLRIGVRPFHPTALDPDHRALCPRLHVLRLRALNLETLKLGFFPGGLESHLSPSFVRLL